MVDTSVRSQEPPRLPRERRPHRDARTLQTGSFIVILPLAVLSLFGIIGLTLTTANAFLDHSKLQNVLDAMALAAAQTVNERNALTGIETGEKCRSSEQRAQDLFRETVKTFGNGTLQPRLSPQSDVPTVKFEYSAAPDEAFSDTCPEPGASRGVFVRTSFRDMEATNFHEMLTGIAYDFLVSASAVAGPATVSLPFCPLPIYVCDASTEPDAECVDPASPNCAYGHQKNEELCGAIATGSETSCSDSRVVGLLDWDNDNHMPELAGGLAGCADGSCPPPTHSNSVGVKMFASADDEFKRQRMAYNTRFFGPTDAAHFSWPSSKDASGGSDAPPNEPVAPIDPKLCVSPESPTDPSVFPGPDAVSAAWNAPIETKHARGLGFGSIPDDTAALPLYQQYLQAGGSQSISRRLVTVPVVSPCPIPGDAGTRVTIQGYACALLTRPMLKIPPSAPDVPPPPGTDATDTSASIVLQLVDGCESRGVVGSNPGGIYRIVLYKDRRSGDS